MDEKERDSRFLLKKPLFFWGRVLLGVIFILAGVDKIVHPAAFAKVIYNYQILPDVFINLAAIILPWLEAVLGVLLILGLWLPGAVSLSNLLLIAFFSAILFNAIRGLDVNCGCFSTSDAASPGAHMVWYIFRDAIFLLLALYLFFHMFLKKSERVVGLLNL